MTARTIERPDLPDMTGALCTEIDPELYFHEQGASSAEQRAAKRLCKTCPVQERCLDYALAYTVTGIWGGMNERERKVEHRRRGLPNRAPVCASDFLPFLANDDEFTDDDNSDRGEEVWDEYSEGVAL